MIPKFVCSAYREGDRMVCGFTAIALFLRKGERLLCHFLLPKFVSQFAIARKSDRWMPRAKRSPLFTRGYRLPYFSHLVCE